jgi:hypothetical protein
MKSHRDRYWPWLLSALVMALAAVASGVFEEAATGGTGSNLPVPLFLRDKKLHRTAGFFQQPGSVSANAPLHERNREGLPIQFEMDQRTWDLMLVPSNRRLYKERVQNIAISFGGGPPVPATMSLRGRGSLWAEGKPPFNIKLLDPVQITPDISLTRFFLVNLANDPSHVKVVLGYRILGKLGLFPLYYQFVSLKVNGQPLGLYLLVEPPEHGLRRLHKDLVAIHRRRASDRFEIAWSKAVPSVERSLDELRSLVEAAGPTAPADYQRYIDLDAYLRWSAFNAMAENYDSLDELFLYELRRQPDTPQALQVMAWDPEDIYRGGRQKPESIADPLLFSAMDSLDAVIVRDRAFYDRYRLILRRLLIEQMPATVVVREVESISALRETLDDGLPPGTQVQQASVRRKIVETLRSEILRRHDQLLSIIDGRTRE